MEGLQSSIDELCNLCLAEHLRQVEKLFGYGVPLHSNSASLPGCKTSATPQGVATLCWSPVFHWKTSAPGTGGCARDLIHRGNNGNAGRRYDRVDVERMVPGAELRRSSSSSMI